MVPKSEINIYSHDFHATEKDLKVEPELEIFQKVKDRYTEVIDRFFTSAKWSDMLSEVKFVEHTEPDQVEKLMGLEEEARLKDVLT